MINLQQLEEMRNKNTKAYKVETKGRMYQINTGNR